MGVIGGNVVLLRGRDAQASAGLEEELVDLDIGRQRARVERGGVGEIGIAGENAVRERLQEAPFEIRPGARPLQGERGEDAQPDRGIGRGAREQRVGDVVGFAQSERQGEHDGLADAGDDRIGHTVGIVEKEGGAPATRHFSRYQPGSGRKRSP